MAPVKSSRMVRTSKGAFWIASGQAKGYASLNGRVWIIPFAVC